MRAIRISNEAYNFLIKIAKQDKRSLIATLDLFIQIFKESQDNEEKMENKSLSFANKSKIKGKKQTLVDSAKTSL